MIFKPSNPFSIVIFLIISTAEAILCAGMWLKVRWKMLTSKKRGLAGA